MTTPPEMGAGTEKRHSGRPAENNRPYAAGSHHLRGTMAEGAGASETQAQTSENRQDKPFFRIGILL